MYTQLWEDDYQTTVCVCVLVRTTLPRTLFIPRWDFLISYTAQKPLGGINNNNNFH